MYLLLDPNVSHCIYRSKRLALYRATYISYEVVKLTLGYICLFMTLKNHSEKGQIPPSSIEVAIRAIES
ncbi:hypothetical protein Hdeb2414_s0004g00129891 [Helianthus debilis subsp. tardiflorus]